MPSPGLDLATLLAEARALASRLEAAPAEVRTQVAGELARAPGLCRQSALARRDALLRQLAEDHYPDLATGAAARMIAAEAERYQAVRWPRERSRIDAPAAEPALTFWRILRLGVPIPGAKRLKTLIARGNLSAADFQAGRRE